MNKFLRTALYVLAFIAGFCYTFFIAWTSGLDIFVRGTWLPMLYMIAPLIGIAAAGLLSQALES